MHVSILTLGSRGDVEPFLALAVGLQASGHTVTIAAPGKYANWIRSYGVRASPVRFDTSEFMAQRRRDKDDSAQRIHEETVAANGPGIIDDYARACEGADLILQTGVAWGGIELAQLNNAALAFAHAFPSTPTREFPTFLFQWRHSFGESYNYWTHRMVERIAWMLFGRSLNAWRQARGLPRLGSYCQMLGSAPAIDAPTLYPFSPSVLPKPLDWPDTNYVTGYWFLPTPTDWEAPPELRDFLASGPPPVLVGFGSMAGKNPQRRTRKVVDALKRSGQRGIIITGGGRALTRIEAPASVLFIEGAPFNALFPKMAAIVHHGGAGTTSAALRAGVPSVILPDSFDQFAWARRIDLLQAGVTGGRLAKLNSVSLSNLILKAVSDETIRRQTSVLSRQLLAERGVANAVEILERHVGSAMRA